MSEEARSAWEAFARRCEEEASESWVSARARPLVEAARIDPIIGGLFPFFSLNAVCFAPTATEFKPRYDYPRIDVLPNGSFSVADWTYPDEEGRAEGGRAITHTDVATPQEAIVVTRAILDARMAPSSP